jgi:hypothetical protein
MAVAMIGLRIELGLRGYRALFRIGWSVGCVYQGLEKLRRPTVCSGIFYLGIIKSLPFPLLNMTQPFVNRGGIRP